MKTQRIILALIVVGLAAAFVALANGGITASIDGVTGCMAVVALVAVAAVDYGFGRRRLLTK